MWYQWQSWSKSLIECTNDNDKRMNNKIMYNESNILEKLNQPDTSENGERNKNDSTSVNPLSGS